MYTGESIQQLIDSVDTVTAMHLKIYILQDSCGHIPDIPPSQMSHTEAAERNKRLSALGSDYRGCIVGLEAN